MKKKHIIRKVLLSVTCALAAAALVFLVIAMLNINSDNKNTNPTGTSAVQGTGGTNTPNITDPSNNSNPSEDTDPDDVTDPSGSQDPSDVTEPSNPDGTEATEPSQEPDNTYPTNPDTGEESIPTSPVINTTPPEPDASVDYQGMTPSTITAEIWNSWTVEQKQAFSYSYNYDELTMEEKYNLLKETECNGYTCGWENHYCYNEKDHNNLLKSIEAGCDICGSSECPSFYARGRNGFTQRDKTKCPQYDVKKDPTIYCMYCGYRRYTKCEVGEIGCSRVISFDMACSKCGVMIHVGECHHCVKK